MNQRWEKISADWPPAVKRWVAAALSVALGLVVAVVLNYVLYRLGLPSKPFIYVAF